MKRFPKKLWNGPTAIGESESRAMELTDLPYMTISSGEFMSRKRGMFREVTKKAAAAAPMTSFRASIWRPWGAPDTVSRALYSAEKPDYAQYPTGAKLYVDGSVKLRFDPARPGVKVSRNQTGFSCQADWYTADRLTRVSWVSPGRYIPSAIWYDANQWFNSTRQGGEDVGLTGRRRGPESRTGIGWYMKGHNVRGEWAFDRFVWVGRKKFTVPFYVVAACIVEIDQVKYVKVLGNATTTVESAFARRGIVGSPDRMGLMNLSTGVWATFNLVYADDGSAMPYGGVYAFNQSGTSAVMTTGEATQGYGASYANGAFVAEADYFSLFAFFVHVDNVGGAARERRSVGQHPQEYENFPLPANWINAPSEGVQSPLPGARAAVSRSTTGMYWGGWFDWVGDTLVSASLKYTVAAYREAVITDGVWRPGYSTYHDDFAQITYTLTVGGYSSSGVINRSTFGSISAVPVGDMSQVLGETEQGTSLSFTPIDLRRGAFWVGSRTVDRSAVNAHVSASGSAWASQDTVFDETATGSLYIDGAVAHTAPIKTVGSVADIARTVPDADGAINHATGEVLVSVYEYGRRAGVNHDGRSSTLIYKGAGAPTVLLTSTDCYHGITLDMQ